MLFSVCFREMRVGVDFRSYKSILYKISFVICPWASGNLFDNMNVLCTIEIAYKKLLYMNKIFYQGLICPKGLSRFFFLVISLSFRTHFYLVIRADRVPFCHTILCHYFDLWYATRCPISLLSELGFSSLPFITFSL